MEGERGEEKEERGKGRWKALSGASSAPDFVFHVIVTSSTCSPSNNTSSP